MKLTFAKGAALADPNSLFKSGLEGHARRANDYFEGNTINAKTLAALAQAAAAQNKSGSKAKRAGAA